MSSQNKSTYSPTLVLPMIVSRGSNSFLGFRNPNKARGQAVSGSIDPTSGVVSVTLTRPHLRSTARDPDPDTKAGIAVTLTLTPTPLSVGDLDPRCHP